MYGFPTFTGTGSQKTRDVTGRDIYFRPQGQWTLGTGVSATRECRTVKENTIQWQDGGGRGTTVNQRPTGKRGGKKGLGGAVLGQESPQQNKGAIFPLSNYVPVSRRPVIGVWVIRGGVRLEKPDANDRDVQN